MDNPSPSVLLAVAHEHQEKYEKITREMKTRATTASELSKRPQMQKQRLEEAMAVENNALLAIAGFLEQIAQAVTKEKQ